jgi:Holliday junction resolvase RusA-like endonuclease
MIRFTVPGIPRGKGRARSRIVRTKAGQQFVSTYTPAQTRSEEGAVRMFAQVAMQGGPPIQGPLDVRIGAYMPVPASWSQRKQALALAGGLFPTGRPDVDNISKLICDSMLAIVYADDSQIVSFSAWKRYAATPRIVVEIRPVLSEASQPTVNTSRDKNEVSQADLPLQPERAAT